MHNTIGLPEPQEIETWFRQRCHLEQYRLRNELAFIQGDHARGGPAREELAAMLRERLATIAKRLKAINSSHELVQLLHN